MIEFVPVDKENYRKCIRLPVKEHQTEYVENGNSIALAKAYAFRDCAFPFAVVDDGEIIGFLQYREMAELGNYLLDKLMIKAEFQGKGYGTTALNMLVERLKRDGKFNKLCLCVDLRNAEALRLYRKLGFKEVEPEEEGEVVLGIQW